MKYPSNIKNNIQKGLIFVPVSCGEIIDKFTILKIKQEKIKDQNKIKNIITEYRLLSMCRTSMYKQLKQKDRLKLTYLEKKLLKINTKLWMLEDAIRHCDHKKDFGPLFVKIAKKIYITNDARARTKYLINFLGESQIIEEKSYKKV